MFFSLLLENAQVTFLLFSMKLGIEENLPNSNTKDAGLLRWRTSQFLLIPVHRSFSAISYRMDNVVLLTLHDNLREALTSTSVCVCVCVWFHTAVENITEANAMRGVYHRRRMQ